MSKNVLSLTPEADPIVARAAEIYVRHTRQWFVGLIAHGSAVKGGFIPGCSDIDLQLYLDDAAFVAEETLPFELGMAIHRDLSKLDPAPFQYIQCYPHRRQLPKGYIGPIPGAYIILAGTLPVAEATADQLRESARATLAELDSQPRFVLHTLLQCGGGKLARQLRLLCTHIWPTVYQVRKSYATHRRALQPIFRTIDPRLGRDRRMATQPWDRGLARGFARRPR